MAAVLPTILPPDIVVQTASDLVPYPVVLNQLLTNNVKIETLQIQCPGNITQLTQPINIVTQANNGNLYASPLTPMVNIFTNPLVGSVLIDLSKENVILDGYTFFDFPIMPNVEVTFIAQYKMLCYSQLLPEARD